MTFAEILAQVITLLQQEGRVSYRALKIRFNLDDEYLEGLKDELIEAKQLRGWGYRPWSAGAMLLVSPGLRTPQAVYALRNSTIFALTSAGRSRWRKWPGPGRMTFSTPLAKN